MLHPSYSWLSHWHPWNQELLDCVIRLIAVKIFTNQQLKWCKWRALRNICMCQWDRRYRSSICKENKNHIKPPRQFYSCSLPSANDIFAASHVGERHYVTFHEFYTWAEQRRSFWALLYATGGGIRTKKQLLRSSTIQTGWWINTHHKRNVRPPFSFVQTPRVRAQLCVHQQTN